MDLLQKINPETGNLILRGEDTLQGKIIKEVLEYMKSNNITHFFVRDIVSLDEFNEKKAHSILNLIKKEIFNPIYDPAYL